ncbi:MAG: DUF86 domain-containing protein [bacterium]|nr:DUF86 domain-containing protein [bacterium]
MMNELLFSKLQRLKEEVRYLAENKSKFLSELKESVEVKKIVERCVYLCSEIALDIADLIIIKKGYPKPFSYSDSIYKLGNYKIIPKEFTYKFIYIAGLRNFLAHDYLEDTMPEIEKFLKYGLDDINHFIKLIEGYYNEQ